MRASGGTPLVASLVMTAVLWLLPAAHAGSVEPPRQVGGVIAFGCDCGTVLPRATIVWSGGRVRIRGDVAGRWSPDGRWFAYGGIPPQTGGAPAGTRPLTHPPRMKGAAGNDGGAGWVSGGETLVFVTRARGIP